MNCPLCNNDVESLDNHHVIPRSLGGENLQTIDICPNCHDLIHRTANAMISGNEWQTEVPGSIRPYALAIVKATALSKAMKNKPSAAVVKLILSLHPSERDLWHEAKRQEGYTNLEKYVKDIISRHVLAVLNIEV